MSARLSKTVVVGGVVYPAGSTVSDDVAKKITAEGVFASRVVSKEPEAEGYEALTVDALKAEIDKRNDGRADDAKISKTGTKAELVAALEADDKA